MARDLKQRGHSRVGLLGTRVVMKSQLYGALAEQEVFVPEGSDFSTVDEVYLSPGTTGLISDENRKKLFDAGQNMIDRGAEVVLLGGTDLFVAIENYDCGFAVLDCAEIHIEAIFQASLAT